MSRKDRLYDALYFELMPEQCIIEDESHMHHVPKDAESHFKITMVSQKFTSLSRIARHRLVQSLVSQEFELGLHALSLHLFTPEEWSIKGGVVTPSPVCKGGKHEDSN